MERGCHRSRSPPAPRPLARKAVAVAAAPLGLALAFPAVAAVADLTTGACVQGAQEVEAGSARCLVSCCIRTAREAAAAAAAVSAVSAVSAALAFAVAALAFAVAALAFAVAALGLAVAEVAAVESRAGACGQVESEVEAGSGHCRATCRPRAPLRIQCTAQAARVAAAAAGDGLSLD